ncbi:unnamed protein product (macronuclear) [Paramecium tetraurelia]|uniref:Uncharacterized protein n=1 Tax=Paramecium tetraurelia TaxID=5888 RepID=A0DST6_PARTE|nr:uncharacterized protein GSPATT00019796001 [Paramecium tetraurelia]CAK86103.1 unnamed protein product [Paramecium tetraurelia]|eukprot:XP_001453500.1 hypothetical protein (macronuclear) [Paramecium tetraurelia strain d4-2]
MGSNSAKPPADAKYSQQELNQNQNQPQVQQPYMGSNQDPKNPNINCRSQYYSIKNSNLFKFKAIKKGKHYRNQCRTRKNRLNEVMVILYKQLDTAMGTFTKGLKAKNDIQEEINKAEERRVEQM